MESRDYSVHYAMKLRRNAEIVKMCQMEADSSIRIQLFDNFTLFHNSMWCEIRVSASHLKQRAELNRILPHSVRERWTTNAAPPPAAPPAAAPPAAAAV